MYAGAGDFFKDLHSPPTNEIIEKIPVFLSALCKTTSDVVTSTDDSVKNAFRLLCQTTSSVAEGQYVLFLDKYQKVIIPWLREKHASEATISALTTAINEAHDMAYPDTTSGSFETFTNIVLGNDYKSILDPSRSVSGPSSS